MHDARAVFSRRGWLPLAAALVLAVVLFIALRARREAAARLAMAQEFAAPSGETSNLSAAEQARRAAVAALGPIKHRGVNAADLYPQAITLYGGLTDAEKKMLGNWKANFQADPALYAKIQPVMDLIRRARKADYSDWGVSDWMENGQRLTAELNAVRRLASLAAWDSNYRFQTDPAGAVNDLAAMQAMGTSIDQNLEGFLIENGIHGIALNVLAQNAASITTAAGPDLLEITSDAAVQQDFQNGLNGDAAGLQTMLTLLSNPSTRSQAEAFLRAPGSPQEITSEVGWLIQNEQQLAAHFSEPYVQFQQWWSQKIVEPASIPFASQIVQAHSNLIAQAEASIIENRMLSAAGAYEQTGQPQALAATDPATGQPFTYTQTPTGFQLTSQFQVNKKPVTLNFTTPLQ